MICAFCIGGDSGEYCSETCKDAAEVKFCLAGGKIDVFENGMKQWRYAGRLHREDGPALVHNNGMRAYWLHGKYIRTETAT